ncbi:MAG: FliA/WhiG family RNA polymerase sigma factor [Clostridiales bacterium]|nr:FliA/WhiG family RNA polymerase sigma factor [Clostridiales bacterium]
MNETERTKLWEEYRTTKAPSLREQLITEYAPMVKIVAGRLNMYLGYTVEYDDLVGYGVFGLIDAIDKYDNFKGVKFETYASLRIRGAILDQIRKMDWIPRTLRQKQKKMDQAMRKLELEQGHQIADEDLAAELGITLDELAIWQNQMQITNLVSLDEFLEQGSEVKNDGSSSSFSQPEEMVEKEELKKMLAEALDKLTENEKKVITLYYFEELTLKEISRILEVSESRISQLHTRALQKLQKQLGSYMNVFRGY